MYSKWWTGNLFHNKEGYAGHQLESHSNKSDSPRQLEGSLRELPVYKLLGQRVTLLVRRRVRFFSFGALAFMVLVAMTGCSLLPQEVAVEKVTTITPPKLSKKPEYTVASGTLEVKVSGSGKLFSTAEEQLFFTLDNKRIKEVYVKNGDAVKKGQLIAELDTGDLDSQIRQKEIQNLLDEIDLKETLQTANDQNEVLIRKAKLNYELKQQDLADLRKQMADSKLTAPFAGTIVSVSVKKGDAVHAYDQIAIVADLTQLTVAAKFSSDDLAKIALGMKATVDINSLGEQAGKVDQLPLADTEPNVDAISDYLLVALDKPLPSDLTRGTPLTVSIVVNKKENVLSIPLSALRLNGARNYVQVVDAQGSKKEVTVETGIETSTDVEIVKGLQAGQKVVGK